MIDWKLAKTDPPKADGDYLTTMDGELVGQTEPFTSICGFYVGKWDDPGFVIAWDFMPKPFTPSTDNKPVWYWPMAITEDGERLFTYDNVSTKEKAVNQLSIWENHYGYKIKTAWIDCANGQRIAVERTWAESSPDENTNEDE